MNNPNSEILCEIKNLKKTYGRIQILKGISFDINKGEVLGYIGPNGAGKTTTIKILLGINNPDEGSIIRINGKSVDEIKKDNVVSYLPEKLNLPEYMTGREYIKHIINLSELNGIINEGYIKEKLELVKFPVDFFDKYIKTYSKGMQQRIGLMAILINPRNELIILDEPVSGLDPLGQSEMIDIIKALKEQGKSIFLTTHQMNEVEDLCDNIIFIDKGEMKDYRTVESALNEYKNMYEYYKGILKNK